MRFAPSALPSMRFLLLNQTFYPDVAATGQYLMDVALALIDRGHEVTVLTSRHAYDEPRSVFPKEELWRGIRIIRVGSTWFGKEAKWKRAADFASFICLCTLRLALLSRSDVVVALTSPPLISALGACFARLHRSRFVYWVMDLNPDEAIAAGWLRNGSTAVRILEKVSKFSLKHARKVIALDKFMRERLLAKVSVPEKLIVLPLWSQDVCFDPAGRQRFRRAHGIENKFVVMYSGNHSPCHPLDTVLKAARKLAAEPEIVFCFVGGGSEFRSIQRMQSEGDLGGASARFSNVLCIPYQPRNELSGSLSAADLHIVVMGDAFVGLVHPCKVYNLLSVGAPILYIGPHPGPVTELFEARETGPRCRLARHGEVHRVVEEIYRAVQERARLSVDSCFPKEALLPKFIEALEGK
jgi:glycosyltransferase involved in cell wall biosynthesis